MSKSDDEDATSRNQFVATAVAEKISALRTAQYFAARKGRTDWAGFDRLISRKGGEEPQAGDEIPGAFKVSAET